MSYPNQSNLQPTFYIQIKGLHSGRPLKQPIANCVAVYSELPHFFELVYLLYKGRKFEPHIIGSVVPFIRIRDVFSVLSDALLFYSTRKEKLLYQVQQIDELLETTKKKIKLLQTAQLVICREFFK